jgi:hypothetical protein
MEITIKKTIEEKVQISLPAYYKTSAHQFKIYSDTHCISVTEAGIHQLHADLPFAIDAKESTELEFMEFYKKVNNQLHEIVNL